MSPALLIPALFVAAVSLALVIYILRALLGALSFNPQLLLTRLSYQRCKKRLAELDAAIDNKRYQDAINIAPSVALFRRIPQGGPEAERWIRLSADLYAALLSRIVLLSDELDRSVSNLPLLEELMTTRTDMMRQYCEVAKNQSKITAASARKGRSLPNWAGAEYYRRCRELRRKLEQNWRELRMQLRQAQRSLRNAAPKKEGQLYH